MTTNSVRRPPCPVCQQNSAVAPVIYGLWELDEAGKAAARRGDFVLGGCCFRRENWLCKRCEHFFAYREATPAATASEALRAAVKRDDDLPGKFVDKTYYANGNTVTLTNAAPGKGYFVVVDDPHGSRVVLEAESRGEVRRIGARYGCSENPSGNLQGVGENPPSPSHVPSSTSDLR